MRTTQFADDENNLGIDIANQDEMTPFRRTHYLIAGFVLLMTGQSSFAQCYTTLTTFYNPAKNTRMQGGANNRYSNPRQGRTEKVQTVQHAIASGRPVTIAADSRSAFGKQCNQVNSRCTLLICNRGFDKAFPEYRKKFKNVPANCFLGIVEDTGSRFTNKGTRKLDIPSIGKTGRIAHYRANPRDTRISTFQIVKNPCGKGAKARECNLAASWVQSQHLSSQGPKLCPLPAAEQRVRRSSQRSRSEEPRTTRRAAQSSRHRTGGVN